jgi:hypothetical protein
MSWVLPSLNVPVAFNWMPVPRVTVGLAGEMVMDTKVALLTLTTAEAGIELS